MSRIPVENASGPSAVESLLADPNLFRGRSIPAESFDAHLQRARTRPDEPAPAARPDSAAGAARPSARDTRPAAGDREDDSRRPTDEKAAGDSAPPAPAEETHPNNRPESEAAEADADSSQRPETAEAGKTTDAKDREADGDEASGKADGEEASGEIDVAVEPDRLPGELPADAEDEDVATANDNAEQSGAQLDVDEHAEENQGDLQPTKGKASGKETAQEEQAASEEPHSADDPSRRASTEAKGSAVEVSQIHAEKTADAADATDKQGDSETPRTDGEGEQVDSRVGQTDLAVSAEDGEDQPIDRPPRNKSAVSERGASRRSRGRDHEDRTTSRGSLQGAPQKPAPNATSPQVETTETRAVSNEQAVSAVVSTVEGADSTVKGQTAGTTDAEANTATRGSAGETSRPEAPQNARHLAEPGQADRERFVQRVARAFEAMGSRNGVVRLRLHPPELGSLRLEITVRNGVMTARVEAETQTARNMLLDNLPVLRERLAQQDIKIEQFNVDLTDRSPGGPSDQTADFAESHGRPKGDRPARAKADADVEGESTPNAGAVRRPGEGTQLNVVV